MDLVLVGACAAGMVPLSATAARAKVKELEPPNFSFGPCLTVSEFASRLNGNSDESNFLDGVPSNSSVALARTFRISSAMLHDPLANKCLFFVCSQKQNKN